jgi:chromosome partitioning protein
MLTPLIPRNVRLSEAPSFGQPITIYDTNCRGAQAYRELSRNFHARIRADKTSPALAAAGV